MATIKFPNEMPLASSIGPNDKLMISKEGSGESVQATFNQAKEYLEITGIELDPIASGALPTPPTGQTRKMVVSGGKTGATWTHPTLPGGSASLTNKEQGVLFWNYTAWRMTNVQELPNDVEKLTNTLDLVGGIGESTFGTFLSATNANVGFGTTLNRHYSYQNIEVIRGSRVKGIAVKVSTSGTMTVLVIKNIKTSHEVISSQVINVVTATQFYPLNIQLGVDEVIAIGDSTDTFKLDYIAGANNPQGGKTSWITSAGAYTEGDSNVNFQITYEHDEYQALRLDRVDNSISTLEEFKDGFSNVLDFELNPDGAKELIPFTNNASVNSQYTNSANFIYENNAILNSKFVKGLNILVAAEGILTVSIVENAGLANFSVIKEIELNLTLNQSYYEINEQLTNIQTISVGKQGNTGIFKYSSGGVNSVGGFFRQRNNTTGAWSNSAGANLNIGVVIETEAIKSNVIIDLYNKISILRGKKVAIVADSISTYANFIPSGNASFYPNNNVTNVNLTWWKKFIDYTGAELILNDAWSGSRASNTGTGSLQTRLDRIPTNTDYILLFIGTNDLGNGVVFGNIDLTTPFNTAEFTDAYCNALDYWSINRPNTKIICFSPLRRYVSASGALYTNGGQTSDTYSQRIKEIADLYCCDFIDLKNAGINSKNQSTYLFDGLHPNSMGMDALFEYLVRVFK